MSTILTASNISKQYRLGLVGTGTLSHDLNRWWFKLRGKEDPYLKVGALNDRSVKAEEDYVWALQDVNFSVETGEVLGIIGKNGAGKSTLLKILSRVTGPSTGVVKTKGRISSLLEVGTGFHPELTGRENIYLNGAILGMTKAEISSKIDEIISFSGCEMYIDTPVKRYSSGMRVRLAFAVAAHLEPDILIIDEVLAVGDAEFQKKAIGKMQDISRTDGRTVLFVSHNMESIQKLCTRCIVLQNGKVAFDGEVNQALNIYLNDADSNNRVKFPMHLENLSVKDFEIVNTSGFATKKIILGDNFQFHLKLENIKNIEKLIVRFQIFDKNEILISTLNTLNTNSSFELVDVSSVSITCDFQKISLAPDDYFLGLKMVDYESRNVLYENIKFEDFTIVEGDFYESGKIPSKMNFGKVLLHHSWTITKK